MAFDIYTQGGTSYIADMLGNVNPSAHKLENRRIAIYLDDFYFINEKVQLSEMFPLLKQIFNEYYGYESTGKIYGDQLSKLESELRDFKNILQTDAPETVKNLITEYLQLIEFATKNTLSIVYAGD